jgi:hypothetical protein
MLVITGTGRSGTSVVAAWLKKCGVLNYESEWIPQFNSGYDTPDISRLNSAIWLGNDPQLQSIPAQTTAIKAFEYDIVKDPKFFYGNVLNTWLSVRNDMKFLICLRKFNAVHKSRLSLSQLNMARKPEELEKDLGSFISQLVFNQIPFEFVTFPEFTENYDEVYEKIKKLHPEIDINIDTGRKIWNELINKSKLHL